MNYTYKRPAPQVANVDPQHLVQLGIEDLFTQMCTLARNVEKIRLLQEMATDPYFASLAQRAIKANSNGDSIKPTPKELSLPQHAKSYGPSLVSFIIQALQAAAAPLTANEIFKNVTQLGYQYRGSYTDSNHRIGTIFASLRALHKKKQVLCLSIPGQLKTWTLAKK